MCIFKLRYPTCNAHAPYCHLWSLWLYCLFPHYLINGTIFGNQKKKIKHKIRILIFYTVFVWNISHSIFMEANSFCLLLNKLHLFSKTQHRLTLIQSISFHPSIQESKGGRQCNSNTYFNKQCVNRGLIAKYVRIKVPNTSIVAKFNSNKAYKLRIKDGIKFSYIKKQTMNYDLCQMHLQLFNEWKSSWGFNWTMNQ